MGPKPRYCRWLASSESMVLDFRRLEIVVTQMEKEQLDEVSQKKFDVNGIVGEVWYNQIESSTSKIQVFFCTLRDSFYLASN